MVQSFLPVQMRQNAPKIYYIGDKNDFLWAGQPPKPQPTAYGAAPPLFTEILNTPVDQTAL